MSTKARFFLYFYCNDVAKMREFYSSVLGLDEIFYSAGPDGGLGYSHAGVQVTILPAADELTVDSEWHRQPGWEGGTKTSASWSFQIGEISEFRSIVARVMETDTSRFYRKPQWQGYWSFPIMDPMGNTVEVTHAPTEAPAEKEWARV